MFLAQFKRTLLASAIMLSSLCSAALAQTTATKTLSQRILPKETYLLISMPSVEGFKEAMTNSSFGRLLQDPALEEFKTQVTEAFASDAEEGFAQVYEMLGLTVDELLAIPSGEVALAFSKAPPNKMGAVILVDFGAHASEVESLLEKANEALQNVPVLEPASAEHDGTELVMFNIKADVAKRTPLAKEFGWFLKDERLVISNSSALMKLMLDNWDGSSEKTLADNDVFAYIMERCESSPGSSLMTTYLDPIGLFTQLVQTGSLGEAGLAAGMGISVMPMLGVNQFKGIGSVGEMGGDQFEGISRSFLYCEQPPQAAMQIFQLDTVDPKPPNWVKEGVTAWMSTSWKVGKAYDAIETLVDMFQGMGAFERRIDDFSEQGPQIHLKHDVVEQLTGSLNLVMASGNSELSTGTDDILISLGVRDNQKIADLLAKLTSQPGFPGETRELAGATIYEIEAGPGATISFTAANNQLLIGIGGGQLEQAVRNDDDVRPLAESAEFQAVAKYYPNNPLMVSFTRPAAQYKQLYEMLREGDAAENFSGMDEFFSKIDFTRLPPFEIIEKYIAPTGGSWTGDENGVLMQQFSLRPEE